MSGGVPAVVRQLSTRLSAGGTRISVMHATGDASDLMPVARVTACAPSKMGNPWWYSPGLRPALADAMQSHLTDNAVMHLHGVWAAPQFFAAKAARERGVPMVLTAHGMLEPWLWRQQGWKTRVKKAMYWAAVARPVLRHATVVHAITPLERDNLRRLFPNNRIEVIPNAIEMSAVPDLPIERERSILFIGRIDAKKGVDILLRAFAQASLSKDWTLNVVGPIWSETYMTELRRLVHVHGVESRVSFTGPQFGDAKRRLLESAWVMVTPSHSEAIGLVNLEAGERQLPSITTHQTGLNDWEQGGGMLVNPEVTQLQRALQDACMWSNEERLQRGLASRALVQRRYSWDAVMTQWKKLYCDVGHTDL